MHCQPFRAIVHLLLALSLALTPLAHARAMLAAESVAEQAIDAVAACHQAAADAATDADAGSCCKAGPGCHCAMSVALPVTMLVVSGLPSRTWVMHPLPVGLSIPAVPELPPPRL